MGSLDIVHGRKDEIMSELERVEGEYRRLATEVIYSGFDGQEKPEDRRRLDELGEELMRLSDPDFSDVSVAAREAVDAC